jgi:hypothetical protein
MRIPSLTYGPGVSVGGGVFRMPIETLITGTKLYVTTALDLCDQERILGNQERKICTQDRK